LSLGAAGGGATAELFVAAVGVGGGLAAVTTIVACIHGCGVQMYVNVPGVENVTEPDAPGSRSGVFQLPSLEAASWGKAPELVHVTVVPTGTVVLVGV
jgi:hypothetical protein